MQSDIQVVLSPELYTAQIEYLRHEISVRDAIIAKLTAELERQKETETALKNDSSSIGGESKEKKTRKRRVVTVDTTTYSDFKSNGKRKPHAADPIRSYQDFRNIQDYYLNNGRVRDWALWTIGVSLGLRISDVLSLRFGNLIDTDKKTFKKRIQIYEHKTGKLNDILITESVTEAMRRYLDSIKWQFDLNGFLFPSHKTKGKMYEECGWRILSSAGKALNLPFVMGSHTMRKSFANIAACVDKSSIDMNAITKVQGLLNHADQRVTMRYLNSYQIMFDKARIAVSDFVLGRTDVNEIIAGNQYTIDDVFERVDALEKLIIEKGEDNETGQ